jgi:hypothetical protein
MPEFLSNLGPRSLKASRPQVRIVVPTTSAQRS